MGPTVPSTSMMPVQPRTDDAISVDGSAAQRAGWSAGADDPRRMAGKRLHLGEARLKVSGSRVSTLFGRLDQRDFEGLFVLAVGQGDESNSPEWSDRFFE